MQGELTGELLEVGSLVLFTIRIVPEAHWHRRERMDADKFTTFALQRCSYECRTVVHDLDRGTRSRALPSSDQHSMAIAK